ncbi:MFS transporter [Saccharothrix yanglingensis]|uniref:MFS transporter n=1 Tax=Saccharothrix yanglingensis TaxID=659496 RepID=A0ABU0X3G9_9PSEU|nr:MFS transporter [Saccharothrix yanglingensis]MDQ2586670.1 MFS transporter [Saccharothrix yanglingensis]
MPLTRSRGGGVLISALIVDSVGNGMFLPLALLFFAKLTEVPLTLIGVLVSLANALTLPIPILVGWLADRVGPLPLVVGAQFAQGIGYLAYVWVDGPAGIFVSSALVALGVRFFWSSVFTAIADFADGSGSSMSKDSWFAWATMARTAGLGIGGLVTAAVITVGDESIYRAIAIGTAACFVLAGAAIGAFVRAPKRRHDDSGGEAGAPGYRAMLRDRPFLSFTGINTIFATTSMMLALGLPIFVVDALRGPTWLAPVVLVGNTVVLSVLAAPVVKRLAPYRRTRVISAAAALWAVWCFLFAVLVPDRPGWVIPLLLVATALFTAAELIHAPVSMALATALSPPAARGRYLASFQYSFTLAGIIGPAFFAALFEVRHWLPWLALGVVNVLAILAMRWLERAVPPSVQRAQDEDVVTAG